MRRGWVLLGIVMLAVAWGMPAVGQELSDEDIARIQERLTRVEHQSVLKTGEVVYRVACATCHGIDGDGQGPEAEGFAQPPTDFTQGAYKLRSSVYEAFPAQGDLERTIREGMPGTEMVPFEGILTNESIAAVAQYLKTFSPNFDDPDAVASADETVEIPEERPFPRSEQSVAAGRELYQEVFGCPDCHGPQGRGTPDWETWGGQHIELLDFSEGVFKSGPADRDLYRTIATGMNNTDMPGYVSEMSEEEIWQMVDFLRSLEDRSQGFFGYLFSDDPSGFAYGRH